MKSDFQPMTRFSLVFSLLVFVMMSAAQTLPSSAEDEHSAINWSKLKLSLEQDRQIQQLDKDWQSNLSELKPPMMEDQKRLAKLLTTYDSDSVEIMALQQAIAQKREKLIALATTNFLKKRQLLTENQQHELSSMIQQSISERQHSSQVVSQRDALPDHIQGLMEKARNIWPSQGEH